MFGLGHISGDRFNQNAKVRLVGRTGAATSAVSSSDRTADPTGASLLGLVRAWAGGEKAGTLLLLSDLLKHQRPLHRWPGDGGSRRTARR